MRPQQNRRMRGRGNSNNNSNNNRKGPNPLTRSYESNGPDVKIRGTAQQIAEKYSVLARDAQTSGDRVMAENYLQHAEHYYRIIMSAQTQQQAQQTRDSRDDDDSDDREESDREGDGYNEQNSHPNQSGQNNQNSQNPQSTHSAGSGPQPFIKGTPAELALASEANEAAREQASANVEQQPGAEATDAAPRKPRRPRRPRRPQQEDGVPSGDGESQEDPVTEPAQ